jgi:hypothetical protein
MRRTFRSSRPSRQPTGTRAITLADARFTTTSAQFLALVARQLVTEQPPGKN